jgi:hypothetical protein
MFKSLIFDLKEVLKLFRSKKVLQLRGLSNRLIREASIETDFAKAELGVIAYALHKIETKEHFTNNEFWHKIRTNIYNDLESAIYFADKNLEKQFIKKLKKIISNITHVDKNLGHYAEGIYEKSKVKQASLAYSYGLSISQAAALTDADKKELQSYIGFTKMHDEEGEQKSIIKRVEELEGFLGAN